jgi:hypothetical protein
LAAGGDRGIARWIRRQGGRRHGIGGRSCLGSPAYSFMPVVGWVVAPVVGWAVARVVGWVVAPVVGWAVAPVVGRAVAWVAG